MAENKKPTDHFNKSATVRIAAYNTIYHDTIGNQHARSDIQKQAYNSEHVANVRQAYGITGTNYSTHTPYINGHLVNLDDKIIRNTEIVLVKNDLNLALAIIAANKHRILPERTGN